MLVGSLGRGITRTWDPLWDSSGIHETCVGPHVTRDTHVGHVARGWLDCLVFSWVFNLACSSTGRRIFRPTITRIWATPKLRASPSSPHLGRSSLCLVWASPRYRLQYLCTYDTGFIVIFLTHAPVTWNAGVKQMLVCKAP